MLVDTPNIRIPKQKTVEIKNETGKKLIFCVDMEVKDSEFIGVKDGCIVAEPTHVVITVRNRLPGVPVENGDSIDYCIAFNE